MIILNDLFGFLNEIAPEHYKESWDNVGLLIGDRHKKVKGVLLSLDLTTSAIDAAILEGANVIITHHPIIFGGITAVNTDTTVSKKIIRCIENGISVYTAHTNLDSAIIGTNDTLFDILKLQGKVTISVIDEVTKAGLGRVGELKEEMTLEAFLKYISECGFENIKYCTDIRGLNKSIKKVGLCTGAIDSKILNKAIDMGCDVCLTGDLTYHRAQEGFNRDVAIIDLGHYNSEVIVLDVLSKMIKERFKIDSKICDIDETIIRQYN
ncbi:MAG: Nif3-like dinuclear metal center hexameric protein [Lachnospirales bacterium]